MLTKIQMAQLYSLAGSMIMLSVLMNINLNFVIPYVISGALFCAWILYTASAQVKFMVQRQKTMRSNQDRSD